MEGYDTAPYATNAYVSEGLLRNLVVTLATLGSRCFPQMYSVIRDTKENSGLLPVPPMDGEATRPRDGNGDNKDGSDDDRR